MEIESLTPDAVLRRLTEDLRVYEILAKADVFLESLHYQIDIAFMLLDWWADALTNEDSERLKTLRTRARGLPARDKTS